MSCNCVAQTKCPKIKVLDEKHRIGAHVDLKKTLVETLAQDASRGSHCVQFFLGSRQNYKVRELAKDDIEKSKKYCETYGKSFYIHCPLIANLSKNPKTYDEKDASILKNSWQAVSSEVRQMNGLPAGCVLHMGSKGSIQDLIRNLNDFSTPRNSHISGKKLLILENASGQGTSIGRSFDEIRQVFEGIDRNTVGFCLDTQHIFGSGANMLSNHEDVVKLFDDIEAITGGIPDVIHLNDSMKTFNSKVDRHQNIGQGFIWSSEKEGLTSLLDICYEQSIDCILETPDTVKDLDLIRTKYMDLQTIDTYRF